jgi:signal transduction histidine kinase
MLLAIVAASIVVPALVALGGQSAEVVAQVFTAGELIFVTVAVLRYRVWGLAPMLSGSLRRVVTATDAERRRIRAELHDGVGAGLTAVRLKVDAAQRLIDERPGRAREMLDSVSDDVGALVDDVRRLVDGLRPAVLDRMGLEGALRLRASELSTTAPDLSIVVRDDDGHAARLDSGADAAVYRLVCEAFNNVVRHARATRCEVTFTALDHDVVIDVIDDGTSPDGSRGDGGLGLSSMSSRAAEVGGYVVAGPKPEGGFRVRAVIPGGAR